MMTPQILTAAPVVEKIKEELLVRCKKLKDAGITPTMSVVLVGSNPASLSYIKNKRKLCEEIGGEFQLHQLPEDISIKQFLEELDRLNQNPRIHGIIIQLPVSPHLRKANISELILPQKDIDGFHPDNTKMLYRGEVDSHLLLPCTPKGIVNLLNFYKIPIAGSNILVIGRSLIVGKPLSMLLTNLNATVTLAHTHTKDLEGFTKTADIIISAVGIPNFINAHHFSNEKKPIVIDVGINSLDNKITGDVTFNEVKPLVRAISPVPGGVGPMTVISLIENLITATETQFKGSI